jgi:hypothetical protein
MTTTNQSSPSIRAIPLPTTGGIPARQGFNLQDHVAASYCIRMISEAQIKEVWSEVHDDVTLIWQVGSGEEVEFVQVKGTEPDQLWSIALLCQPDYASQKKDGTSIFERSLSRHGCSEPCRFRIVTARDVKEELRPLTHALESQERSDAAPELAALVAKLANKIPQARSPNGLDGAFWVSRTVWHVVHALEAMIAQNLIAFEKQLEGLGHVLLADQREELYGKLVRKVWDAALATHVEHKKITREQLLEWLKGAVAYITQPSSPGGKKMAEKMEAANLPSDAIVAATDSRTRYRMQVLMDRYSAPMKHVAVEAEIVARLNVLRARLDAGEYPDDGPSFHMRCLNDLGELYNANPDAQNLGLAFLHGCMYSITDRCGHRFRRVTQ